MENFYSFKFTLEGSCNFRILRSKYFMGFSEFNQSFVCVVKLQTIRIIFILPTNRLVPGATIEIDGNVITQFSELPYHFRSWQGEEKTGRQFCSVQCSTQGCDLIIHSTMAIFQHLEHQSFFIVAFHIGYGGGDREIPVFAIYFSKIGFSTIMISHGCLTVSIIEIIP